MSPEFLPDEARRRMPLDTILAIAGAVSALLLVVGLIGGIVSRENNRAWRIWPAPPVGSLKSFVFWTLFRTLNIVVLVLSVERLAVVSVEHHLTIGQMGFATASAAAGAAYFYALWSLGREATYCQASGLATGGVYRWTRNPQYATAIAAFAALGVAADARYATPLAAALVTVYALMAVAEEPWLEARYGREYLDYKAEVPRFINLRHAWTELAAVVVRQLPSFADGRRDKG
jgi:protein-S-isoprenylcysteine O-methyltransferase Ste14